MLVNQEEICLYANRTFYKEIEVKEKVFLMSLCFVLFTGFSANAKKYCFGKVDMIPGTFALFKGIGADFQMEMGYSVNKVGNKWERFFMRKRLGLIYYVEPWFFSIGGIFEWHSIPSLAGGVEIEFDHLYKGFWGQSGVSFGAKDKKVVHFGAGVSIFGAELQYKLDGEGEKNYAFLGKIKIPLGILFMGLAIKNY